MPHSTSPVILAVPEAAAAAAVGSERVEGGQPVRRFRKELVRAGKYVMASGLEFDATPQRLARFAAEFGRWKANGNKVPVPLNHTFDPEKNRGWLEDVFVEGESLIGVIDLVGDGIKLAGTTDVSIYAPPQATDGKGNVYEWPITHVALCTDPAVPGLSGFVPLAASLGSEPVNVPVLKFSKEAVVDMTTPAAGPAADAMTGADPAEAVVQAILDKVTGLVKDKTKTAQEKKAAFGDLMKRLEKALGVFEDVDAEPKPDAGKTGGAEPVAASRNLDPMLVQLARKSRKQDLDGLVASGRIVPAVAKKLAAQWIDGEALALSLTPGGIAQFDALVGALGENEPVTLGERTRGQTVTLSRDVAVSADDDAMAKAIRAKMEADVKAFAGIK